MELTRTACLPVPPAVDVLLVIDDSPSMHEEAAALAENLRGFSQLYQRSVLDYRIAVTSTDLGNPSCDPATADDGALLASSCRARPEQFVRGASVEAGPIDVWDEGCASHCGLDSLERLPTALFEGGPARPRPWLERVGGVGNLPDGVDPDEALACLGSLGVSGCAFESPLAAAARALERSADPRDPAFGFLRPHAALLVLFITDEDDCSHRAEHGDVFEPGGDRALWSDPTAPEPTSAVCWSAGVACEAGDRGACHPVHRGPDGAPVPAEAAVLEPPEDHIALYEAIDRSKRAGVLYSPDVPGVYVRRVGGTLALEPAGAVDPQTLRAFGTGPACTGEDGREAFPAPRLQVVVDAFPQDPGSRATSICEDVWIDALACVPAPFGGSEQPWDGCFVGCPEDEDPSTPGLQPRCRLERHDTLADGRSTRRTLPRCEWADDGEPCWWPEVEDRGPWCLAAGGAFEVRLRDVVPAARGTCLTLACAASTRPRADCPDA